MRLNVDHNFQLYSYITIYNSLLHSCQTQIILGSDSFIDLDNESRQDLVHIVDDDHESLPLLVRLDKLALILLRNHMLLSREDVAHHHPAQQELLAVHLGSIWEL